MTDDAAIRMFSDEAKRKKLRNVAMDLPILDILEDRLERLLENRQSLTEELETEIPAKLENLDKEIREVERQIALLSSNPP